MGNNNYNGGSEAWGLMKQIAQGRWFFVFASFLMMIGCGTTYIYGTYSKVIKTEFNYSQTQINTLGFAKDLGSNAGIFVGVLAEVAPMWGLFVAGALLNFGSYFMIWLSITGRIAKPKLWQMFMYISMATNAANFSNTAILVTSVRNFPERRGIILGLLKGFVGIAGGVLTQLYLAIYGHQDPSNIVLLFSWLPSVVILLFFMSVRPINLRKHPEELKVFYHLLYVSVLLALFILFLTLAQKQVTFSHAGYASGAAVIVALLCLPLLIAFREEFLLYKLKNTRNVHVDSSSVSLSIIDPVHHPPPPPPPPPVKISTPILEEIAEFSSMSSASCFARIMNKPPRGEDFTILQAMFSKDMALVCLATFSGCGSSLAAIDNFGQIGESLGYPPQATSIFVSWVSVFNFFGRVFSGFVSETLMVKYKLPRPIILAFSFLLTCIGQLCIAYPIQGSVYAASLIIGFGFGAQGPLLFAIISELFGLKHFSVLFNWGQLIIPFGSYILNVDVVGKLYDMEAIRQGKHKQTGKGIVCKGAHCFGGSFTILAFVSFVGSLAMLLLAYRTREFYKGDVYKNYKEDLWIPPSEMEFYRLNNKKNDIDD